MALRRVDADPASPLADQLRSDVVGPVFATNRYVVEPRHREAFLTAWHDEVRYLRAKTGFIATQLYEGVGGSQMFFNIATWESCDALRTAGSDQEFHDLIAAFPPSVSSPHLVQPVAVPGICLGISGH